MTTYLLLGCIQLEPRAQSPEKLAGLFGFSRCDRGEALKDPVSLSKPIHPMSAPVQNAQALPCSQHDGKTEITKKSEPKGNYKGFVAGVFSGISKLSAEMV